MSNLPEWFSIGVSETPYGAVVEFNGIPLPTVRESFTWRDLTPVVVPSALEWLTLPDSGYNPLIGLDFTPLVDYSIEDDPTPQYFVSRSGQTMPGVDGIELSADHLSGKLVPNAMANLWVQALRNLGCASPFDLDTPDYWKIFTQLYGFSPDDTGAKFEVNFYYGETSSDSYVELRLRFLDVPDDWSQMGYVSWTYPDLSVWRSMLGQIVSYTGNRALLDSVDCDKVRQDYLTLNGFKQA